MAGNNVCVIAVRSFVIAAVAAIGFGCKANFPESPTPAPTVAAIQLHYNSPHVFILPGSTVSLTLYALNTDGVFENVTSRGSWSSINPNVAAVTPGQARGGLGGSADVIASYGGQTTTARIEVHFEGQPQILSLWPHGTTNVGLTSDARAILGEDSRNPQDVTAQAQWTSSDPSVFTVTAGHVTSMAPGTASITATYQGATAKYYASVPPLRRSPGQR